MEHNKNLCLQNKSLLVWLNEDYSARGGMRWYFYSSSQKLVERLLLVDTMHTGKIIQNLRNINVGSILVITHTVYKQNVCVQVLEWVLTHSSRDSCSSFFFWEEKETLFSQGNECRINTMETNLFCSFWDMLPGEVSFFLHSNLHGLGLVQRLDKQQMQWQKCHSLIHYFVVELKQGQVTVICPLAYHLFDSIIIQAVLKFNMTW